MNNTTSHSNERFFPEDYRAFCAGVLSCCIDRFGGIESVGLLDTVVRNAQPLFARRPIQLFSRAGTSGGRPFIYPALRALREYPDGGVRPFVPEYPSIHPSAVVSGEYEFVMTPLGFSLRLRDGAAVPRSFVLAVSKAHYYAQTLLKDANYNQLAHEDVWLPPELRGSDFNPALPFHDAPVEITRHAPEVRDNALVFRLRLKTVEFDRELFFAITASLPFCVSEDRNQWVLRTEMVQERTICFGVGYGAEAGVAVMRAREAVGKHAERLAAHISSERFAHAVQADIPALPEAARFLAIAPRYQESLTLEAGEHGIGIRAAANKYGFFPIWDHIYPIRDFLLAGRPEVARRAFTYMLDYPHWDTNPFVMMHLAIALDEYLAFQPGDTALLNDFLPAFRKAFTFAETLANPETGLILYGIDTAVDVMQELGLPRLFHAACVNGWWYDSCCVLANFAGECGDAAFAESALAWQKRIETHYEEIFFDAEAGALRAAVGSHGERTVPEVFLHTKSLAMDYVHGWWLFRRFRERQADFLMKRLWHTLGLTAVAYDSEAPAIYLKGTRMNQHLGHCCKLLRMAGRMDGVCHLLDGYLYAFAKYQNAIETFNYSYCNGNQCQNADWQAFSATAAQQAIVQGAIGLAWHRGGLCYLPVDGAASCSLHNLHFAERIYELEVTGEGSGVAEFTINGHPIIGTMQLPADSLPPKGTKVQLSVRLGKPQAGLVLLWALDLPVGQVETTHRSLCFTALADRQTFLEILAPVRPELRVDGALAPLAWCDEAKRAWWSGFARQGTQFSFSV
ncbi:MAG: hypothetical protein IJJ33_19135 [Victivallales bacterium]|nr:hypothetical protein [Victivallales bacterium]